MTTEEFEEIKKKINKLELDAASSKGKIEAIESAWKKKYGFISLEEAKKRRDEINNEIKEKTEIRDKLMNQLETSYDWDSV